MSKRVITDTLIDRSRPLFTTEIGCRFGVPVWLLFLVVGMFFGSDGLGMQFHNAQEAQFIGMVPIRVTYL